MFDFQLIGGRRTFWGATVVELGPQNIDRLAELYVDQVKKKAQLFRNKNKVSAAHGIFFATNTRHSISSSVLGFDPSG